jgi:uncharacterized delta-60 repeat protein
VARLEADGTLDTSFRPDLESTVAIDDCPPPEWEGYGCSRAFVATALALQPDGKILIAGFRITTICTEFSGCWEIHRHFLARFHPDGRLDAGFVPAAVGDPAYLTSIRALAMQPDGRVLVAGLFYSINGMTRGSVARLLPDGRVDAGFAARPGVQSERVEAMALQPDGKVVIAGGFDTVNGSPRRAVARLMPDGALDPTFDTGTTVQGVAFTVALQPDGRVLVAGYFTLVKANATVHLSVARLHATGATDATFDLETGPERPVRAIALQRDGGILIGGEFSTIDGFLRPRIARLYGGPCPPDLRITRQGQMVLLSWASTGLNTRLEANSDPTLSGGWSPIPEEAVAEADRDWVRIPIVANQRFFRLVRQPSTP